MENYLEHRRKLKLGIATNPVKPKATIAKVSEKQKAKNKANKPKKEIQDAWYLKKVAQLKNKCMECGGPTKSPVYVYSKATVAHVLPKRECMFPSVATHEDNSLELCTENGCHYRYDNSWEDAAKMKVWPLAVEKFRLIFPFIATAERKNIPDVLLQEVESV